MADISKADESKKELRASEASKLPELTEQNLKFLSHLQAGLSVKDAYQMAGYEGKSSGAPYLLYQSLKERLQVIVDADGVDSLRLRLKVQKILDLPLEDQKISAKTLLKAVEVADKLTSKDRNNQKPSITAVFINRNEGKPDNVVEVKAEMDNPSATEASEQG